MKIAAGIAKIFLGLMALALIAWGLYVAGIIPQAAVDEAVRYGKQLWSEPQEMTGGSQDQKKKVQPQPAADQQKKPQKPRPAARQQNGKRKQAAWENYYTPPPWCVNVDPTDEKKLESCRKLRSAAWREFESKWSRGLIR